MPNLTAISRDILSDLTPRPARIAEARQRAEKLIADLHRWSDRFSVRRVRPFGSIHRGTGLAQFRDIDYLIPVDERDLATRDGQRRTAARTLGELATWVEHCRAGVVEMGTVRVRLQKHSVGLEYRGTDLRVDLVPALLTAGRGKDIYLIPSREYGTWIRTRLDHIEQLADDAPPRVLSAIRLLKGWKRARGKRRGFSLPSYALEMMMLRRDLPPHNQPPLQIAADFIRWIAEASAKERLSLDGFVTTDPVAYRDPWSGENLLGANDRAGRVRLIKAARWSRDKLDEAAMASERRARSLMYDVFVGAQWR